MISGALGAVLIGGRSRRMGADKAQLELGGVPMAHRVAAALASAGLEVVTVGSPDRIAGFANLHDAAGAVGPIAGLWAALEHARGRPVFLAAADQPLLRAETVRELLIVTGVGSAVVPLHGGHPQVTCAVYRAGCLAPLRRLASDRPDSSIRDLLAAIAVEYVPEPIWSSWGEDGSSWYSIDTPGQLAAARSRWDEV